MKQKMVIRVHIEDDKTQAKGCCWRRLKVRRRTRSSSLGKGIGSVTLTASLRRLMGLADLIGVGAVEEPPPEKKELDVKKESDEKPQLTLEYSCPYQPLPTVCYYEEPAGCSIL